MSYHHTHYFSSEDQAIAFLQDLHEANASSIRVLDDGLVIDEQYSYYFVKLFIHTDLASEQDMHTLWRDHHGSLEGESARGDEGRAMLLARPDTLIP